MSGPLGEVEFDALGKKWTLRLGTYALALLQRKTGVPTMKFFEREKAAWGADDVLQIFVAGLHRHKLTEEKVGEIMDDLGSDRLLKVLEEAKGASFGEAGNTSANPPNVPANGTGTHSSGNGLAAD